MKPVSWAVLGVMVAFVAGWLVGGSGRSGAEVAAGRAREEAAFASARALVLEAQVNLVRSDFGDARRLLDEADRTVESLQRRLRETGRGESAGLLEVTRSYLRQARDLAAARDPSAGTATDAALQALERARGPTGGPSR